MRLPHLAAAAVLLAAIAPAARGDPFDRRHVPADARWVVHLDVDAARPTKLWQAVIDRLDREPGAKAKLGQIEAVSGMRFPRDLHDVTVYGQSTTDEAGVAVVHADVDRPRLLACFGGLPGYAARHVGGHDVVTWADGGKPLFAAFHGPATVVFARTEPHVVAALDVLDGTAAAVAADSTLAGAAPPATRPAFAGGGGGGGPLAFVAVTDIPGLLPAGVPGPFRPIAGGWLTVAEAGGSEVARATVMARTAEAAGQLRTAADGFKAMVAFSTAGDADPKTKVTTDLLAATAVGSTDRAVTVDLTVPLEQLRRAVAAAHIDVADDGPTTAPGVRVKVEVRSGQN